jgi:peptide/nickel transport system permease protein
LVLGGCAGLLAGFGGGIIDSIIMRIVDVILAFPGIIMGIFLASFIKVNILSIIGILTFSGWAGCARLIRGEIMKYKKMDFVMAARSYNASFFRIVFLHFLPILFPIMTVQAILGIGEVILAESALNFLGIGLGPEIPTLGLLIDSGLVHLFDQPSLVVVPGVVLFWLVLSFNLIGEGLRMYFER